MNLSSETKVKDIALSDPRARKVLEAAGLDYCCGGSKSLQEACLHADVSAEEILNRLRQCREEAGLVQSIWLTAPLQDLSCHIREKHHQYVRDAIPRIQALLRKVRAKHGENHPEIAAIENLFAEVGQEMIMHMQKEEHILFPYIDALERSAKGNGPVEPPFFRTVRNPIHTMMKEHDAAGDLVKQIRKASSEYDPPADVCMSFQALYQDLERFEEDLHEHVHLENNILFPRAVELEGVVT